MSYSGHKVGDTATVTGTGVRIRSEPVTGSTLYTATKGHTMEVVSKDAYTAEICWYMVKNLSVSGKPNGWIRGDYLSGSAGGSFWDDDSLWCDAIVTTSSTSLNMREGPGTNYAVVTQIPKGARVKIIGTGTEQWVPTKYLSYQGYCSADYLSTIID